MAGIHSQNVVFDVFKLEGGTVHRVMVEGRMKGSATGYVTMDFLTNKPPFGGSCTIDKYNGKFVDLSSLTYYLQRSG